MLLNRLFVYSQSCQIRHPLWIPVHRLEPALFPLLHGSSAILAPLLPCVIFRHFAIVRNLRLDHVDTPS